MTRLDLPVGSRSRALFDILETRFISFQDELPTGIAKLARQRAAYHGDFDSAPFGGLASLNPVLVGTPWLFWECFQSVDDGLFQQIAEAGAFYVLASVVLDHLVDRQTAEPGLLAVYHQALYSRGAGAYRATFPTASPFWLDYHRLESSHLAGLATETELQGHPLDYSMEALALIAHGKVAPIVLTLVALCHASGQPGLIPALEASLNHIAVASQLLDDIGDWQADWEARHLTYFLGQLSGSKGWERDEQKSMEEMRARMKSEWTDVQGLQQVRRDLESSLEAVDKIECPAWNTYVQGYIDLTDGHLEEAITIHLRDVFKKL